jgi:glutamine---fructose-6-phosphate transaminase (isomerizing)
MGENKEMIESSSKSRTFQHAMLREIYEQPTVLAETIRRYMPGGKLSQEAFSTFPEAMGGKQRLVIAASGSSRNAGLAAEIMLEDLAGLAVDVEYASEYCYRSTYTLQDPGVVVVSQSGETADTLASLREARLRGLVTLAITNNPASTMATEADCSLPTYAGKELAIPATKSFSTQLTVLYTLTLLLARLRGRMTAPTIEAHGTQLTRIPELLQEALPAWETQCGEIAADLKDAQTFLYLGRGVHYAIAREGALKLKESAYLQAEGYPAGELKHGPNALVSQNAPLVILATRDPSDPDSVLRYSKTLQLMKDMKQQGAQIVALATDGDQEVASLSRHCISIPEGAEHLLPILEVVPLQLLAYKFAVQRGIDVDSPRNLVKAVVQE